MKSLSGFFFSGETADDIDFEEKKVFRISWNGLNYEYKIEYEVVGKESIVVAFFIKSRRSVEVKKKSSVNG